MPLQETSGAASYDAYGGGVAVAPVYIEDVMSTFLYTGNGSTQTITNGVDLAGEGGLVWIKPRNAADWHALFDTNRGANLALVSNRTDAQATFANSVTGFTSSGFTLGNSTLTNASAYNLASWTFRKAPKFFDVVTYTGNGTGGRTISHTLGSVPGCMIVKRTDTTGNWAVYHRSTGNTGGLRLNATDAFVAYGSYWFNTTPTATEFTVGNNTDVNASGGTYVAYLFAHNAGGFGLTGTDNVISCGSYTGNGSATGPVVTLGYEPQWLLVKQSSSTGNWFLTDTMRGFSQTSDQFLLPNSSGAEFTKTNYVKPLATGFQIVNADFDVNESGGTYIYIAIRRGPMKVPTDGTKVFNTITRASTGAVANVTGVGFPPDLGVSKGRTIGLGGSFVDRLRGAKTQLNSYSTSSEIAASDQVTAFTMDGVTLGADVSNGEWNTSGGYQFVEWFFRRAPSTFDEVCYTGDGTVNRAVTHNLAAAPELIIVKNRSGAYDWPVYCKYAPNFGGLPGYSYLNSTNSFNSTDAWPSTPFTSTTFNVVNYSGFLNYLNASGANYVAYLWATNPGVTKVGSYTGNGSTQTINCGFTGGSRFVMIKATNTNSGWWIYDTARGMTTVTDPFLQLNSTASETATSGSVTTVTTGFAVNEAVLAGINTNGNSYIFLSYA